MQNNMFTDTISRFRNNTTVQQLTLDFKNQMRLKIFKKSTLQPQQLLRKYATLQRKYAKNSKPNQSEKWQDNERKLFLWFILAYSRLHFKKLSQITDKEWSDISACFGGKNTLLMKFQARALEKSSQRVRWSETEKEVLSSCCRGQLNGRWSQISRALFFKTEGEHYKTAKQCRQHWLNHLDDHIKRGDWTIDQDLIILNQVTASGHHWSKIVEKLSSRRTEHMVKNRFGSLLSCGKKLLKIQNHSIPQRQLIPYLIQELNSNKEFVITAKAKESSSSHQDSLNSSPEVKEEENQNYYDCQKTEVLRPKQQLSLVKVGRDKENADVIQRQLNRQHLDALPLGVEAASKKQEMLLELHGRQIRKSTNSNMIPQIISFSLQKDFSSLSSLKIQTGKESDSPFYLQVRLNPSEQVLPNPSKPSESLIENEAAIGCSELKQQASEPPELQK